jgi:hypothetical protein
MSELPLHPNIRSPRYWIARTEGRCWHCGEQTRLIAVALPPGHEILELDEEAPDEAANDVWSVTSLRAFLFHIDYLPDGVRRRLFEVNPFFRRGSADVTAGTYWGNHCEHCDSLLVDHELFCEPGAFLPTNERDASLIHLLPVDEAFEALAAGYAVEPQFFDAMSRG